jgi:hypothetical protein
MSEQNVVEVIVIPEVPKVIPNEEIYVYVPVATNTSKGIASFDDEFFNLVEGVVSLSNDFVSSKQDKLTSNDVLGTINGQVFKFGQSITIQTLDYVTSEELNERVSLEVSKLVNSAPETLDTLGEIAIALESNKKVVEILNDAVSNKVDKNAFDVVDDKVTDLLNDVVENSNSILSLEESIGEIETALDDVIAIQNTLIGGAV